MFSFVILSEAKNLLFLLNIHSTATVAAPFGQVPFVSMILFREFAGCKAIKMRSIYSTRFNVVRVLRRMTVTCCSVVLFTLLMSCRAPVTSTVVQRAESPDGKLFAILVDRYYHTARVSDEFFLVVIPSNQNADETVNARHIDDSSALIATWANKVQLHWQSDDTLFVICDSCGLRPIDISRKLDHIGSIKIVYQGFPEHTAYS